MAGPVAEGFACRVAARAEQRGWAKCPLLCVGIDPHFCLKADTDLESVWTFYEKLVMATHEVAICYKPNIAFFECLGAPGIQLLERICKDLRRRDLPILLDAKRGDIGSTAVAYAATVFDRFASDAVTVSPYMGQDSVMPFIKHAEGPRKGIFVLCKTSNPGSGDLQTLEVSSNFCKTSGDVPTPKSSLYLRVADMAARLEECRLAEEVSIGGGGGCVGLVVGATDGEALRAVRERHPVAWILAPGVGAQGANLEDLKHALSVESPDCSRLIVSVSRAVSEATDMRQAALEMAERFKTITPPEK